MQHNNADLRKSLFFHWGAVLKEVSLINSVCSNISDVKHSLKKKKKKKPFLRKSEADEASSDITAGVPVSCALVLRIALQPHARVHAHTRTDVCMAYSGRHACQQRWRALS